MEWQITFSIIVIALVGMMFCGVPISFSMVLVGFGALAFCLGVGSAVDVLKVHFVMIPQNFLLLAVPLFILMAQIMVFTGIAAKLFSLVDIMLSGIKGGLVLTTIAAGAVFAAVSGSSIASCAALGPIGIGAMTDRKYSRSIAAGAVAAAGALSPLIPPSTMLILYGFIAEKSVAELFIAAFVPGVMVAIGYAIYVVVRVTFQPSIAPPTPSQPLKRRLSASLGVWPMVILIFLVLGTIYMGVATPTEAAAMSVSGAIILSFAFKEFSVGKMVDALTGTARSTCFIMLILVGALTFGNALSFLMIPHRFTMAIEAIGLGPIPLLMAVCLMLMLLGCVMDVGALILVVVPIILPALEAAGLDPIWVGILLVFSIEMGVITPPVGFNLFVVQGVGKEWGVTYSDVVRGAVPFLISNVICIGLMIRFPAIVLWLPSTM